MTGVDNREAILCGLNPITSCGTDLITEDGLRVADLGLTFSPGIEINPGAPVCGRCQTQMEALLPKLKTARAVRPHLGSHGFPLDSTLAHFIG